MSWLVPKNQLDREQRNIIQDILNTSGNVWIDGFPGSGKSILILYIALELRKRNPIASIVIVEFTQSLIELLESGMKALTAAAREMDIPVVSYYEFNSLVKTKYDYLLCDEAQDLPANFLNSFLDHADRVIVAADFNQKIYTKGPVWHSPTCSKEELKKGLKICKEYRLHNVYRITVSIADAVKEFLSDMDMHDTISKAKSNTQIRLWRFSNEEKEAITIIENALQILEYSDEDIAILLPSHDSIH